MTLEKCIKGAIFLVSGCLIVLGAHRAVMVLASGFTIGRLGRALAITVIGLIIWAWVSDPRFRLRELRFSLPRFSLGFGNAFLILITSGVGLFVLTQTPMGGNTTYLFITMLVILGVATCIILALTRDSVHAFALFLLVQVFANWLEADFLFVPPFGEYKGIYFLKEGGYPIPLMYVLITPSIFMFWLFTAATLIRKLITGDPPWIRTPVNRWILVLVFFLLIASIIAVDPARNLSAFYHAGVLFPLFFFLTTIYVRSREDVIHFSWALLIYCVLKAAVFYYFYLQKEQYQFVTLLNVREKNPVFGMVSQISVLGLAIAVTLWGQVRRSRLNYERLGLFCIMFILGTFVLVSEDRGYILPVVALIILWGIIWRQKRKYVWGTILIITMVGSLLLHGFFGEALSRFALWDSPQSFISDQTMRIDALQASPRMMIDHPFGIGLGNWSLYFSDYSSVRLWQIAGRKHELVRANAHNIFFIYGVSGGWGALIGFVAIVTIVIRKCMAFLKRSRGVEYHVGVGLLGCFLVYIFEGLCSGLPLYYFWGFEGALEFWVPTALVLIWTGNTTASMRGKFQGNVRQYCRAN